MLLKDDCAVNDSYTLVCIAKKFRTWLRNKWFLDGITKKLSKRVLNKWFLHVGVYYQKINKVTVYQMILVRRCIPYITKKWRGRMCNKWFLYGETSISSSKHLEPSYERTEKNFAEIITISTVKGDLRHVTTRVTCCHGMKRYFLRSSATHVFYLSIEPDTARIPLGLAWLVVSAFKLVFVVPPCSVSGGVDRWRRARNLKGRRGNAVIL